MPPDLDAFVPTLQFFVAALVGAVFGITIRGVLLRGRPRPWRNSNRRKRNNVVAFEPERPDAPEQKQAVAADQLRIVMGADFEVRRILNKGEARVFDELNRAVMACNATWHVMAQVSLGEILRCSDRKAYGCINSKRVDLLLVDADCMPRYAIEYQGKGHHRSAAAARDAVKKEALRRAGIGYYEVVAGQTTPAELRRLVERLVGGQQPTGA
jgi:hypothetical protein